MFCRLFRATSELCHIREKMQHFFQLFFFPIFYKGFGACFVRKTLPRLTFPPPKKVESFSCAPEIHPLIIARLFYHWRFVIMFPLGASERAKGFYFSENNSCAPSFSRLVSPRSCADPAKQSFHCVPRHSEEARSRDQLGRAFHFAVEWKVHIVGMSLAMQAG